MHWIAGLVVTCLLVAGARPAEDHDRTRRDTEIAAVDALAKLAVRRGDAARTIAKLGLDAFAPPAVPATGNAARRVVAIVRTYTVRPLLSSSRSCDARGPPVS